MADGNVERLMAGYLDRPLFAKNFGAAEALDAASGRSLDDWTTFYQGASRLVEYLRFAGYNGVMLSAVADGTAIYPTTRLQSTPRYDTGVFFSNGQDPIRKDVLELVLRLCDRVNVRVIPAIHFTSPLPELEEFRRADKNSTGLDLIGRDGTIWQGDQSADNSSGAAYNVLDPRRATGDDRGGRGTGRALRQPSLARWAGHRAIGLELCATAGTGLGLGRRDDGAFSARHGSHGGRRRPQTLYPAHRLALGQTSQDLDRLAHHANHRVLSPPGTHGDQAQAGDENLSGRRRSAAWPRIAGQLAPGLADEDLDRRCPAQIGIDPEIGIKQPQIVLLRPQRIHPTGSFAVQAIDARFNDTPDLDAIFRRAALPGSLFFHEPDARRSRRSIARAPSAAHAPG